MPVDRTTEFRRIAREKEAALPESKRAKGVRPSKDDSSRQNQLLLGKEYIAEAYVILNHITTLTRMLSNIRKPYLNTDSRIAPLSRQATRQIDLAGSDAAWAGIRHLTNEERDQIDLQARVILTRCADRVKEMEALEKRRTEIVASRQNPLSRLLPARLRQDTTSVAAEFVAAHHSSITWYLNRRLAEASQNQKEMQEERVKRQLERTRNLGSGATHEALNMSTLAPPRTQNISSGSSWLGDASTSFIAATIGAPNPNHARSNPALSDLSPPPPSSDDEDDELELSSSQILEFEAENANILRSVQDSLQSVQQAESRLMDISALQMELVTHLTRQTELTDQLYEDAIATTADVDKGNVQLKEAKRRANDGRMFILLFLLGASFSLLFLHYY